MVSPLPTLLMTSKLSQGLSTRIAYGGRDGRTERSIVDAGRSTYDFRTEIGRGVLRGRHNKQCNDALILWLGVQGDTEELGKPPVDFNLACSAIMPRQ